METRGLGLGLGQPTGIHGFFRRARHPPGEHDTHWKEEES